MKDNLFEMLFHLFESGLTKINEEYATDKTDTEEGSESTEDAIGLWVRPAQDGSVRVIAPDEQVKLTKIGFQFLMRMKLWQIIDANQFELIINQLQFSESTIVTLKETKWTIRSVLQNHLSEKQLAFLDLVLYQSEDQCTMH